MQSRNGRYYQTLLAIRLGNYAINVYICFFANETAEKPFDKPITIGRRTCWLIYLVARKGSKFQRRHCIGRFSQLWNITGTPVGRPVPPGMRSRGFELISSAKRTAAYTVRVGNGPPDVLVYRDASPELSHYLPPFEYFAYLNGALINEWHVEDRGEL